MTYMWLQTWILGIKSLLLHPLRSLLTVLGIFIGVASVVWLLAIGEGISQEAQKQIEGLGADNIIVRSIKPSNESITTQRGPVPYGITRDDFALVTGTIPTIERALPIREIRQRFFFKDRSVEGRLVGCTPEYAEVTHLELDRGHFVTDAELTDEKNVCALAAEVAERLFPFEDPIGQSIHVEQDYYTVVGVMKPRSPTAGIGGSFAAEEFADDVYIPISALWGRIGDQVVIQRSGSFEGEVVELSQMTLRVNDVANVLNTAAVVEETMKLMHDSKDYGITVPLQLLEQAKTTRMMFMIFMGLIAAISLVVGGIGIMNIMLATVTERTREIGIRRALGATRNDITRQFLAETVVLSVVGGATGILIGLTCGPVSTAFRAAMVYFFPEATKNLPEVFQTVTPVVVPWSLPLAFFIAVGVGLIFGIYPAIRAASMDPIEALRHE